MANIKSRYAEITKSAKARHAEAAAEARRLADDPRAQAEARLFAKFRKRARADFRTLMHGGGAERGGRN